MGKDEKTTHGTAAVAAIIGDTEANFTYWNHLKTVVLIVVSVDRHAQSKSDC